MEKFLITKRSGNKKTGPMLLTTSPRKTCPTICPFRKDSGNGACYAEHGMLGGFIWTKLDRLQPGGSFQNGNIKIHNKATLLKTIRELPEGTVWRHNQAGDLPTVDQETIDEAALKPLVLANRGKRGFTYTHFDVVKNKTNRRIVKAANKAGFIINLSANSLDHADELYDLKCAPVTVVVPATQMTNTTTPKGRAVIICPAITTAGMNCKDCQICAKQRNAIVAFPALGAKKGQISSS